MKPVFLVLKIIKPSITIMKIFHGIPGVGRVLTEKEIVDFLKTSKKNLQLGTIDEKKEPNVHPVWYLYENEKLYIATEAKSKKLRNIQKNNTVYFSIDDDSDDFRGVRGKGVARIIYDIQFNVEITEKIVLKYAKSLDGNLAKEIMNEIKDGSEVLIEITPKFYSAWTFEL